MYGQTIDMMHGDRELPYFELRQEDLPAILNWEVNQDYYLLVKVKMVNVEVRADLKDKNDKSKREAGFQVMSIRTVDSKTSGELNKKDFEEIVGRVKSGEL